MATKTDDGMSFAAAQVIVSADGAAWTDISGHGASVAVGGGEREVGEQNVFAGDTPIVKAGQRSATTLTVRYVYTEEAGDPFEVLRAQHETVGGAIYVQYSPKGGFWFKTGAAVLVKPGYPGGDAKSGDTVMSEFVVKCAELTKDTESG
jgi:hypothetical protein